MAQSSYGWRGTVSELQWAQAFPLFGHGRGVARVGDCAITQVAGSRAVSVAAGSIFGDGVVTALSSAEVQTLPTPTNGQWFLLVLNRIWSSKTSSLTLRNGPTTATATSGDIPASFPASLATGVGGNADVPVAWLWGNSTGTAVTIVPLLTAPTSVAPRSGDAAARDALYGVPTTAAGRNYLQAQRAEWHRPDLGWTERYYAGYNATTSPNGVQGLSGSVGAWLPVSGAMPYIDLAQTAGNTASTGEWTSKTGLNTGTVRSSRGTWDRTSTTVVLPFAGCRYEVFAEVGYVYSTTPTQFGTTRARRVVVDGTAVGELIPRGNVLAGNTSSATEGLATEITGGGSMSIQALQDTNVNMQVTLPRLIIRCLGPA